MLTIFFFKGSLNTFLSKTNTLPHFISTWKLMRNTLFMVSLWPMKILLWKIHVMLPECQDRRSYWSYHIIWHRTELVGLHLNWNSISMQRLITGLRKIVWMFYVGCWQENVLISILSWSSRMNIAHSKVLSGAWNVVWQDRISWRRASHILWGRSRKILKSSRLVRPSDDIGFKCIERTACLLCNPARCIMFLFCVIWQRS